MIYAHRSDDQDKSTWQTLDEHSKGTADRAKAFASLFGGEAIAEALALYHDVGKSSEGFQAKLEKESKKPFDHSTLGAQRIYNRYKTKLYAYAIAGHHCGLANGTRGSKLSSLEERLNKKVENDQFEPAGALPDVAAFNSLFLKKREEKALTGAQLAFFASTSVRMEFSCLVDADRLDAERYSSPEKADLREEYKGLGLAEMSEKLKDHIATLSSGNPEIDAARNDIYKSCLEKARKKPGLFLLSTGTGSGKTLASAAFSLEHAKANGLQRVVYALPFTTIVEQTASEFKKIFNPESVLEHHCHFEFSNDEEETFREAAGTENWDRPFIVTTTVQLFNSLYSNKPSQCRKNHNLARSVIVLDEVQALPDEYIRPCLAMLGELVANYGATVVMCTATQPVFDDPKINLWMHQLDPTHLVPKEKRHEELFESRVQFEYLGETSPDEIAAHVAEQHRALAIVSTRKAASDLYDKICSKRNLDTEGLYHLSALMVPVHRADALAEIKNRLKDKDSPCIVVSTQLIEAGVDIDFPVVYRDMAGIDSILQAAGRCNREGSSKSGKVYVFDCQEYAPKGKGGSWLYRMRSLGKEAYRLGCEKGEDFSSPSTVKKFFQLRYGICEGRSSSETRDCEKCSADQCPFDKEGVLADMADYERFEIANFNFESIGESFRLVEEDNVPIFVPWEKGRDLLRELKNGRVDIKRLREAQLYTVSVPRGQLDKLEKDNYVSRSDELPFWVLDCKMLESNAGIPAYTKEKGLCANFDSTDETLIV